MSRWFRSHAAKLDNVKVLKLSDAHYRAWDSLLCVACRSEGVLPDLTDTALAIRKPKAATQKLIDALIAAGLFVKTERGVEPHEWSQWQYKSDVSTDRVKQHRERQRNVSSNVPATLSESRVQRTEDLTPNPTVANSARRAPQPGRAALIPIEWEPGEEDLTALRKNRPDLVGALFEQRMLDFRNWCRASAVTSHHPASTWDNFMRKTTVPKEATRKPWEKPEASTLPPTEPWEQRLRGYRPGGFWKPREWGARPEETGCRAPADLLAKWGCGAQGKAA